MATGSTTHCSRVPHLRPRRHGSWTYLSISATPAADMDPQHGPPFASRVRPSFAGHPNYALFGDDTHRLEDFTEVERPGSGAMVVRVRG